MSTTTTEAAAQASAPAILDPRSVVKRLVQPVTGVFEGVWGAGRWIWHFDLGAAVLAGEQTARFVKTAVKKGKEVEPTLLKPFRKAGDSVSDALGEVGTRLKKIAKPAPAARHSTGRSASNRRARAMRTAPITAH